MDRVRNEEVESWNRWVLASRADKRVLTWFGHVERMARRVLMAEVSIGRVRGKPRLCSWMV